MEVQLARPAFRSALGCVHDSIDGLDESRHTAAAQVASLLDGGWRGDAAESFEAAWQEWLDADAQVTAALRSIADALALSERELGSADDVAGAGLATLHERLDR